MNQLFLSNGSDPYAHLRQHFANVQMAPFQGMWTTVEIQPDAFARQRFSVGVIVAGSESPFMFKLLDDLAKFECLYGKDDLAAIRSLLEEVEYSLARAQKQGLPLRSLQFETSAVVLGDIWPTSGSSKDAVLDRLFFDCVPFIPNEERRAKDFATLDNRSVRRLVEEELKNIASVSFEKIVTEPNRQIRDTLTGDSHWLEFNLEPPNKAGNVISGVYKSADRVELSFLRASRDLATYARLKTVENLALFVMTPQADSMPPSDFDRLENVLGEQSWSLEKQGFTVIAHDSAAPLAKDVWDWAGIDA